MPTQQQIPKPGAPAKLPHKQRTSPQPPEKVKHDNTRSPTMSTSPRAKYFAYPSSPTDVPNPYPPFRPQDWIPGPLPLLGLLAIVVTYWAIMHTSYLERKEYFKSRVSSAEIEAQRPLWNQDSWWPLAVYINQWLDGRIPGDGFWNAENAKSLREHGDKETLKALVRHGIVPLYIQEAHGWKEIQEQEVVLDRWTLLPKQMPVWKRSHTSRAVFEFAIPRARGWALPEESIDDIDERRRRLDDERYIAFLQKLVTGKYVRRATRWRIVATGWAWTAATADEPAKVRECKVVNKNVKPETDYPYEEGAMSWYKAYLPFKKLRTILEARGTNNLDIYRHLKFCEILRVPGIPVMRIEAADGVPGQHLDKEILFMANRMNLDHGWNEEVCRNLLRENYRNIGQEPPREIQPNAPA